MCIPFRWGKAAPTPVTAPAVRPAPAPQAPQKPASTPPAPVAPVVVPVAPSPPVTPIVPPIVAPPAPAPVAEVESLAGIALAPFFAALTKTLFKGRITNSQVQGTKAILAAWPVNTDMRFIAYALATAYHETAATMQPIEEYGKGKGRAYGVAVGPWHNVYDGRGDVQLTWEANYVKATQRLHALGLLAADVDLDKTPALAMDPITAGLIMSVGMTEGWFTGKKLADYFTDTLCDWQNARRIINGTDKMALIAGYAEQAYAAVKAGRAALAG
jgi:hypothetical protein